MEFIENPVLFLGKIESIQYNIGSLTKNQKSKTGTIASMLLYQTMTGDYIKTFSYEEEEKIIDLEKNNIQDATKIDIFTNQYPLTLADFLLFSFDNKYFFDYMPDRPFSRLMIDKNPYLVFEKKIKENRNNPDFCFYVCDITRTIYSKVSHEFMDYFLKSISKIILCHRFIRTDNIFNPSYTATKYIYNYPNLFYFMVTAGVEVYGNDRDTFMLISYNEEDFSNATLKTISKEEICDTSDKFNYFKNTTKNITLINEYSANFKKLLEQNPVSEGSVFGKTKKALTDEELSNKIAFLSPITYGLNIEINNHTQSKGEDAVGECINTLVEVLIDKILKDKNNFEACIDNIDKYTVYLKSAQTVAFGTQLMKWALYANPKMYDLMEWKEDHESGLSKYLMDESDHDSMIEILQELFATRYITTYYLYMEEYSKRAQYRHMLKIYMNEFLETKNSKSFVKELIILDLKYMFMKEWNYIVVSSKNECQTVKEKIGIPWYKGLFEAFKKSAKLYSLAIAKFYNLAMIPEYDDFEDYNEMKPKKLLEKAILTFPYDEQYYKKYVEFGGEIKKEIETFAAMNFVDIKFLRKQLVDVLEAEKENKHKEQQESNHTDEEQKKINILKPKERERIEEGQRRITELKLKDERLKVVNETFGNKEERLKVLNETFGNVVSEHRELFESLLRNPIYKRNVGKKFDKHQDLVNFIFNYIDENFSGVTTRLYPASSERFYKCLKNLQSVHGNKVVTSENTLFYLDNTAFRSGKNGFVLTTDFICSKAIFIDEKAIPINEINSIKVTGDYLYINNEEIDITLCQLPKKDMRHIMVYCICHLLYIKQHMSD